MPDKCAMLSWAPTPTYGISARSVRMVHAQRIAQVTDTLKTAAFKRGLEAELASAHREKLTDCSDLTKLPRLAVGVSDMNEFCSNNVDTAGSEDRRCSSTRRRDAVAFAAVALAAVSSAPVNGAPRIGATLALARVSNLTGESKRRAVLAARGARSFHAARCGFGSGLEQSGCMQVWTADLPTPSGGTRYATVRAN